MTPNSKRRMLLSASLASFVALLYLDEFFCLEVDSLPVLLRLLLEINRSNLHVRIFVHRSLRV